MSLFFLIICSVSGMANASHEIPKGRREEIADVLLYFLRRTAGMANGTGRTSQADCATHCLLLA